ASPDVPFKDPHSHSIAFLRRFPDSIFRPRRRRLSSHLTVGNSGANRADFEGSLGAAVVALQWGAMLRRTLRDARVRDRCGLDRAPDRSLTGSRRLRTMRVPAKQIEGQLQDVFRAWGMSEEHAATTAAVMVETDLRGVDSHGISMLPTYDKEFRAGRLNMRPVFKTLRDGPAMALVAADASLGHPASVYAMNMAVDKCLASGVAAVSVVNSHHFGAAGYYSKIAADRGVIGMVTSATRGVSMVPTFGAEPVMGTNPIAF